MSTLLQEYASLYCWEELKRAKKGDAFFKGGKREEKGYRDKGGFSPARKGILIKYTYYIVNFVD